MVGVRQDIQELARQIEAKTRKLDILIDDLIEELKHRRILESVRVSNKPSKEGKGTEEDVK